MSSLKNCIERYFNEELVSSIAVRVGCGDDVLIDYYKSENREIGETTLFDVASVTKVMVTTPIALIAIDKGFINLDDKVSKFFSTNKNITVKNLLTHTMGIGYKNICSEKFKDNIQDYILAFHDDISIGSDVLYSCPGFILLGKILEKVFSDKLDNLFVKFVKDPLELERTAFLPKDLTDIVNANIKSDELGIVNDRNCRFLDGVAGNAGLFSCIKDVEIYAKMLMNRGRSLFSEEIFTMASKNYTKEMSQSRGLGFLYVDDRYKQTGNLFKDGSIGHCGHTGQSVFLDYRMGLYAIILSDATKSTVEKFGHDNYDQVKKMREEIHNAIKEDIKK